MSANESRTVECSAADIDEAAVWIARLHGPERTLQMERGFRRWLAERPSHAAAFEKVSAGWELAGQLPSAPFPHLSRWQRAGFREGFIRAGAVVAAAAAVAVAGVFFYASHRGVATQIGEQRTLALEDGSRIYLNTATRVAVRYDEKERRVQLETGEALFEVAKRPDRPFIVTAGNREVRALGTVFAVRRDSQQVAVVLVEGKVEVRPDTLAVDLPTTPLPITLSPGQRLTFMDDAPPKLDEPSVEKVTAWRRGQIDLDEVSLAQAVAEMNRYSVVKLAIERPEAAQIAITGVFRAGDTPSFAAAVARSYGLHVIEKPREILLAGVPGPEVMDSSGPAPSQLTTEPFPGEMNDRR